MRQCADLSARFKIAAPLVRVQPKMTTTTYATVTLATSAMLRIMLASPLLLPLQVVLALLTMARGNRLCAQRARREGTDNEEKLDGLRSITDCLL